MPVDIIARNLRVSIFDRNNWFPSQNGAVARVDAATGSQELKGRGQGSDVVSEHSVTGTALPQGVNRRAPNTSPRGEKTQPACLSSSVFMYVLLDIDDVVPIPEPLTIRSYMEEGRKGSQFQIRRAISEALPISTSPEKRSFNLLHYAQDYHGQEVYRPPARERNEVRQKIRTTHKEWYSSKTFWFGACGHPFSPAAAGSGISVMASFNGFGMLVSHNNHHMVKVGTRSPMYTPLRSKTPSPLYHDAHQSS